MPADLASNSKLDVDGLVGGETTEAIINLQAGSFGRMDDIRIRDRAVYL